MMYPVDNIFWTKLKRFADYEPVGDRSRIARRLGLDWNHQGTAVQPDRPTAGAAEKSRRDRAKDDTCGPPPRPAGWASALLQRPALSEYLGRCDVRLVAGQLFGCGRAGGLLPDRLCVGARDGDAHPGRRLQVPVYDAGRGRQFPQWVQHLQAASARLLPRAKPMPLAGRSVASSTVPTSTGSGSQLVGRKRASSASADIRMSGHGVTESGSACPRRPPARISEAAGAETRGPLREVSSPGGA
jgi:hypothetical protein